MGREPMCGIQTYLDCIPPDVHSDAEEQCNAYEHCARQDECRERWVGSGHRYREPYEWLRCSDSCPRFEYRDD